MLESKSMKKVLAILVLGLIVQGCSTSQTTRNIQINNLEIREVVDASQCKTGTHYSLYLKGMINEDTSLVIDKLLSEQIFFNLDLFELYLLISFNLFKFF